MRTRLCDVLGIEVPIIQAPVTSEERLPLAVASAGALGMLQGSWLTLEEVGPLVSAVRGEAVGINFVLEWPQEERLARALDAGARIVSFFWGDPASLIPLAHDAGAVVLATVASAEEARRAEAAGADVVVAQGWEAGGHVWGEVATSVLVPAVVDAVEVPVVAAGGIADGRGIAAALALGADGVWVGTRFVASEEAPHLYKERILAAQENETVYTRVFSEGWPAPHRVLRNDAVEAGAPRPPSMPRAAEELELAALYAGQTAGLVHELKPAAEIVRDLVAETATALQSACCALEEPGERPR